MILKFKKDYLICFDIVRKRNSLYILLFITIKKNEIR